MRLIAGILLVVLLSCVFPGAAFAAEEGSEGWGWFETLGRWINLFILFGIIAYYVREPITRFFGSRRAQIQREIESARQAKQEAAGKLAAIEERMKSLDREIENIRRQAEEEAEAEKQRILEAAEREAEKIMAAAGRDIGGLTKIAQQELRARAAEMAVELAEQQIRKGLDRESHERVIGRFFDKMAAEKPGRLS